MNAFFSSSACECLFPLSGRGRDGSLLMETLLVLPVLLMLLGGLFLLGDLVLGRMSVQDIGRHEAWTTDAAREYMKTTDAFAFAEIDPAFRLQNTESSGFQGGASGLAGGNSWGWGRRGFATASSELPFWTAFLNVQHDVMDTEEERMRDRFDLHSEGTLFAPSFDYHRIHESIASSIGYDMGRYSRTNEAAALEEELIVGDAMFARDATRNGRAHGAMTPYTRNPLLIVLSE